MAIFTNRDEADRYAEEVRPANFLSDQYRSVETGRGTFLVTFVFPEKQDAIREAKRWGRSFEPEVVFYVQEGGYVHLRQEDRQRYFPELGADEYQVYYGQAPFFSKDWLRWHSPLWLAVRL